MVHDGPSHDGRSRPGVQQDQPSILTDPTTGRPILMAPARVRRPRTTGPQSTSTRCPLCVGHEADTPPEVDAAREPGSQPNQPGWQARAFPNLYPAWANHEVIAEGSDHTSHPVELGSQLWDPILALMRRRIQAMESDPDVRCAFLFKNVGHQAGASIEHNHSQILGLPMLPPRLQVELEHYRREPDFYHREIDRAAAEDRIILRGEHHVVLSPAHPKLPFETWLLPYQSESDFLTMGDDQKQDLANLVSQHFEAIDRAFPRAALNWYLHRVGDEPFHWHFELQPRTGQVAGLELGGDMYINSVTGQQAAERIRGAS